ncbi:hypothetical protein [Frigidibacter oleivorans]|uniref:hypothetical protein n=1 Tax=Frigidibacter oleivorans TaxID=2487129 RepID=UPI0013E0AB18|nr:hypothetical protein [Frigidibacter oleivorans]
MIQLDRSHAAHRPSARSAIGADRLRDIARSWWILPLIGAGAAGWAGLVILLLRAVG